MPIKKSKTTIIKKICIHCNKPAIEESHSNQSSYRIVKLQCGHSLIEDLVEVNTDETDKRLKEFKSSDGRKLYPFQIDTVKKILEANGRVLINHEMGLGKTVIDFATLALNLDEMCPVLLVCKSSLKLQMFYEAVRWLNVPAQVVDNGKEKPLFKFFKIVIISYDTLSRVDWSDEEVGRFKTILLDECQQIKNPTAARTKAVRRICSNIPPVPRKMDPNLPQREKIKTIARDLMKYHGVDDRFQLFFEDFKDKVGLTECRVVGEGIIGGRITIDKSHAENDSEEEVIETILHEIAHAITPGAGHRDIWFRTCKSIGGNGEIFKTCAGTVEIVEKTHGEKYILATSGTPIKNSAKEYFPILNILRPELFPGETRFVYEWVETYSKRSGAVSYGGIRRDRLDEWKNLTKEFIFRSTRAEVMPDLPKILRQFRFHDLSTDVMRAYQETLKKFQVEMAGEDVGSMSLSKWGNILAYMNRMRQIVGMSKVEPCIDYVEEFLLESSFGDTVSLDEMKSPKKITIFVHHQGVGNILEVRLNNILKEGGYNPILRLSSDLNSDTRQHVVDSFKNDPKNRIMIASTLASGEGLNLQFCSDCIMLERQWNPANEEQAEGRFSRIGSVAGSVNAIYFVAIGTIDEFFSELVEKKRGYMAQTLDGVESKWEESSLMKELAMELFSKGKGKWKLPS